MDVWYKYSQIEASIGFFFGINPQLTLRKAMKEKIDDIITWIDLDNDETKILMKKNTTRDNTTQEIVIPTFDVHHKVFDFGNEEDRITMTFYQIRTSSTHNVTLKRIICKASHPETTQSCNLHPMESRV